MVGDPMILREDGALAPGRRKVMKRGMMQFAGSWDLERDATLRLHARDGISIRALRGTLLVTREGDAEDHVLEPGEELNVTGRGLVVAWALAPSSFAVAPLAGGRAPATAAAQAA
jgi:Protein of unknown function (DUF2917)